MDVLWFLIIGVAAGWIAGRLVKDSRMGLLGDLVVGAIGGAIGGVIGGHVFVYFDVSGGQGHLGALVTAVVGAVLLLWSVRLLKR